ncbi:competence type IV pilus assembly protein ComGB [Lactococcus termiticola]|uniref:Competence protein ComGB n=1 Tax=Lactococcus termiticola TaxID=2169526 RepID=A0A2R5HJM3_9LACT|nr:competence type IV pilus assembly protein ComGB [Lactococcus termiticola]GBG96501.1 competence protein ComGB [Lactococcus termiticola]
MANLFSAGFHLAEVVDFLRRSRLTENRLVEQMQAGLLSGQRLSDILEELDFSKLVLTQLSLAEEHGDLASTLVLIETQLRKKLKVQQKLLGLLTYPLILLFFLFVIIFVMKSYLLPNLEMETTLAVFIINHLLEISFGFLAIVALLVVSVRLYFKRLTVSQRYEKLMKLPFLKAYIQTYLTAFFAREWGNLISQGLTLEAISQVMQDQKSPIFQEVGHSLQAEMQAGQSFSASVASKPYLKPELALMIEYGEFKDKLGIELSLYADESWEAFFDRLNRAMLFIQPLIFSFVALMILLIYAAMLLPIYNSFNQF